MAVESWDPRRTRATLTPARLAALLGAADALATPRFGLDPAAVSDLAALARHAVAETAAGMDWAAAARELPDDQLVALVRLFTRAEAEFSGWEAGDASPVIPLVAELKARGRYDSELTAWIKSNSRNRFLPYGNLMNRL